MPEVEPVASKYEEICVEQRSIKTLSSGQEEKLQVINQVESQKSRRLLDHNAYATKKTVGQGMLDIALLTTNVSQLKYLLQVGKRHEFYYLLITLVSVSILLQVFVGVLFIIIARLNVNEEKSQEKANILNNIITAAVGVITAINIISSSFNMKSTTDGDVEP
ncbi:ninjurin-2-like isoform X2 [Tachypleus tridentatus]|uniref:ninjurin-2-like isoform X2 n=1 Tax=Tachypleus tridentatus TaxID=6853 RepID=UPI003FD23997